MRISEEWEIRCHPIDEIDRVSRGWSDLQPRSNHSFFQSWYWIGAWLGALPAGDRPLLLEARYEQRLVALGMLGSARLRRHRVLPSRALLVSESGVPSHDALTVEHNGLLLERGMEPETIGRACDFLLSSHIAWDELVLNNVEQSVAEIYQDGLRGCTAMESVVRSSRPYFYVDMAALRDSGVSYTDRLSANCRHQVRRALRLFGGPDAVDVHAAESMEEARIIFMELRELHQAVWRRRGVPGAFATEFSVSFHEALLSGAWPCGVIQMIRVSAAGKPFGYLYNFVYEGVVYNYQSAFCYVDDNRFKPGLVSHYLAIMYNAERGRRVYDFLMGEQRFKRSLSTHQGAMLDLTLGRAGWKMCVDRRLTWLRSRLKSTLH